MILVTDVPDLLPGAMLVSNRYPNRPRAQLVVSVDDTHVSILRVFKDGRFDVVLRDRHLVRYP